MTEVAEMTDAEVRAAYIELKHEVDTIKNGKPKKKGLFRKVMFGTGIAFASIIVLAMIGESQEKPITAARSPAVDKQASVHIPKLKPIADEPAAFDLAAAEEMLLSPAERKFKSAGAVICGKAMDQYRRSHPRIEADFDRSELVSKVMHGANGVYYTRKKSMYDLGQTPKESVDLVCILYPNGNYNVRVESIGD